MSSTASNYDMTRLVAGIGISGLAFVSACISALLNQSTANVDSFVLFIATALYGVMMFASSYVEEEQHFWYWIAGGWFAYLRARRSVSFGDLLQRDADRSSFQSSNSAKTRNRLQDVSTLILLAAHRIMQRWNQTGQKHLGAQDIVKGILYHHPTWLWALVGFTYTLTSIRASIAMGRGFGIGWFLMSVPMTAISAASLAFKVSFTASDAPELFFWMDGPTVEAMQELDLLPLIWAIFGALGWLSLIVFAVKTQSPAMNRRGKILILTGRPVANTRQCSYRPSILYLPSSFSPNPGRRTYLYSLSSSSNISPSLSYL
jgi:ethanolaminephosphotransferase